MRRARWNPAEKAEAAYEGRGGYLRGGPRRFGTVAAPSVRCPICRGVLVPRVVAGRPHFFCACHPEG